MQEVNVKVAVRVRPLLPKERLGNEAICVKILSNTNQLLIGKDKSFTFDHCLSPKVSQEQLYVKCVEPLVKSCFDGYNATVFAYGQTGSGKTYTIGGGSFLNHVDEELGVIPRAIRQIYDTIQSDKSREYTVKVSYFEIYKEDLRDLLDLENPTKDLHIRDDNKSNTVIMGASELECATADDVMEYLGKGSASRRTGSTQMNEYSSRSHAVFTLLIEQRWSDAESTECEAKKCPNESEVDDDDDDDDKVYNHYTCSKFHFVDLAGSERAHRTGNAGDRLKESIHINTGLLALGNVISSLGDAKRKVTHVPYRDSKITRVLKDSLGGNAKTVMICCISPASSNLDESLNALKYANRARNIKNKPVINRDPRSVRFEEMQTEIKALREELQRQKTYGVTSDNGSSQKGLLDIDQMRGLEEKATRLETECSHYRMIADEAYKQLSEVKERDLMSRSQVLRLGDWLELMEEIKNKVPASLSREISDNHAICRLEKELNQCKRDLQSDEEIFDEKTQEIKSLQERIAELELSNEELIQKVEEQDFSIKNQQELLISKQIEIDSLQTKLKTFEDEDLKPVLEIEEQIEPTSLRKRAFSVPVHKIQDRLMAKVSIRNIHSSPAVLTFDRVVQNFRARSRLLTMQLEDADEILQKTFPDDFDDSTAVNEMKDDGKETETDEADNNNGSLLSRSDVKRGTYKVKRRPLVRPQLSRPDDDLLRKSQTDDEKLSTVFSGSEQERISESMNTVKGSVFESKPAFSQTFVNSDAQRKQLKQTELDVRQSTQKMKDLSVNIKMKEQLIRELVKTGQESQQINLQYQQQVIDLKNEKDSACAELRSLQVALKEFENKEKNDKVKTERFENEFKKKMELANLRIHVLQKKQKDMEKMAAMTVNDKRIQDLEMAVERMKQQQEQLQRRLKDELDRKNKLEKDLQKEQQRIRDLEMFGEQQKIVMKVKMEEMSLMQRKLRTGAHSGHTREDQSRLDEQKKWLDQEMERVLEQRKTAEELEKELSRREEIIAKKEAMLAEKSELEIKKLRSSQIINKDIIIVSSKLESIEEQIKEKTKKMTLTPREEQGHVKDELAKLMRDREKLKKQRKSLEAKIRQGTLLSTQEDRRLIELDEEIEALDAAIDFKNELINSRQADPLRSIVNNEDSVMNKLGSLSTNETRSLLIRYFNKVIELKDNQRKTKLHSNGLEVKIDEQESLIRDLETSLQQAAIEADRKVTKIQQEYERKIQLLMRKLMEREAAAGTSIAAKDDDADRRNDARINQLEKELYYYKTIYRDLKKRLQEGSEVNLSGSVNSGMKRGGILAALTEKDILNNDNFSASLALLKPNALPGLHIPLPPCSIEDDDIPRDKIRNVPTPGTIMAPVRVSRRDLRRLSNDEVVMRRTGFTEQDVNGAT